MTSPCPLSSARFMEEFLGKHLRTVFEHLNWLYALVAVGLGALHAMEPGHGKALIAIYFVGRKRTLADVFALAVIVTLTHTFSVVALAALGTWLVQSFWQERLMLGVELVGGAAIIIIGGVLWFRA